MDAKLANSCANPTSSCQGGVHRPRNDLPVVDQSSKLASPHAFLHRPGNPEIIGQEPNGVEKNTLLTKSSRERRVDLVDDQHPYLQLPGSDTGSMAQRRWTQTGWQYGAESNQKLFIKIAFP